MSEPADGEHRTFGDETDHERVLYEYAVETILPMLKPDGFWIAPGIAPLPAEKVERQLRRIAEHEAHKRQTVTFYSNDRKTIVLHPTKQITVTDDPDHDTREPA